MRQTWIFRDRQGVAYCLGWREAQEIMAMLLLEWRQELERRRTNP